MEYKDVVITHGVRTAIGKIGKSLKDLSDTELGTLVLRDLIETRAGLDPAELDQVILGEVKQKADPANIARVAALNADIPDQVPCYTVNRQCGSGLQAIIDAYEMIKCGEAETIAAGGVENMSQSVYFMRNVKNGLGNGSYKIEDSLTEGGPGAIPEKKYGYHPMGITAEKLADVYGLSREMQDRFAMDSQEKIAVAIREGRFREQILPVELEINGETRVFDTDEHPFLSSMEKLAKLRPAFKPGGTVTAGNSSGRNDGASAVLVMSAEAARRHGYQPMARILGAASSGCDPTMMGLGPVECSRLALERSGLTLNDIDVIELNEAFAAQSLAVLAEWKKWGVSDEQMKEKLNPNGGAIAHGHPLGCTGSALTVKAMYEMKRVPEKRRALITLCCAGGLGVALVIEKC